VRASTDALLDEWNQLRQAGVLRVDAARRLGIRVEALERMLYRHRDDPRAQFGQRAPVYVPARDERGRWAAA
jgi:hypothetical protein